MCRNLKPGEEMNEVEAKKLLRNHFPLLETERLRMRRIEAKDTDALFRCITDPLVRRHTTFQKGTLLFPSRLFRYFDDTYISLRDLHFAVERREQEGLIGICSLQFWVPETGKARLGYLLSPEFWNRGYATEAAGSVISFGFDALGLNRIEARCAASNPASEQVLRKCGFYLNGDIGDQLKSYMLSRNDARPPVELHLLHK